ncbi:MAG: S9 family peptidase [Acidobacteria bacterium]|nr:S9 family peptidase [Acidobacteriota bacterium]
MNRHTARIEDLTAFRAAARPFGPGCRAAARWRPVAVAVVALFLPTVSPAQDTNAIEPHHVATLQSVGTVELSPDGSLAAYLLAVPRRPLDEDSGSSWTELHVLDMSEPGSSRPYVTGEVNVGRPTFRGNGEILYTARRGTDKASVLYGIPIGGGESRKLVEHAVGIGSYVLSPDGNRIAFLAREETAKDLEKLRDQGFNQEIYEEDRSLTRLWIADVPTLEADRHDEAKGPVLVEAVEGSVLSAVWSPTGERLAAVATPTALIDDSYTSKSVVVVDATKDDYPVVSSTRAIGKLGQVEFSPNGEQVAAVSAADPNDPAAGRLILFGGAGDFRDLMPDLEGHVASFAWEDDEHLLYSASVGVWSTFGRVSTSGKATTLIEPGGPISLSFSRAREVSGLALVSESPDHPREIYRYDPADPQTAPVRMTNSNPWLDDLALARQETIRHRAPDGLELEGLLIYPLDYDEATRYPLIMIVHGGPESHYSNGWLTSYSNLGQLAAARGFAAFYPNYRGSTGRGVEFSKHGQAAAAGKEFEDLVTAVDHLIEIGLVDRDRVGITGGSYGGYASAWGTTFYSDRFAASIPFVGISNNISKMGTTDIPEEMHLVHHLKRLWEDWEYFEKSSPIYYVQRNRTPTLILHGKEDPRVHPSQSLELYRHLKTLGQAPVRLVLYPGEGHGNRRSAARFDYMLRTLRWMEHYLKGPGGEPPPREIDYAAYLPWAEKTDENEEAGDGTPEIESTGGAE